ncbi:MAG: hypothetical protein R3B06_14420 [Kofleriaceae bacterium]
MDGSGPLASLTAWQALDDDARAAFLAGLASQLGDGWQAGRTRVGRCGLGELVHAEVGVGFACVPGGWLRMGLSCDDLFAAAAARDRGGPTTAWGGQPLASRPTRWVRVRPFLLALAGVPPVDDRGASDGGHASETYRDAVDAQREARADGPTAQALIDAYDGASQAGPDREPPMRLVTPDELAALIPTGFRLPSEAELEWALREGGTTRWIGVAPDVVVTPANRRAVLLGELANGFGLVGLRDLQNLCADGAVDYDVASPTDQDARGADLPDRIARWAHTYWQDDDAELLGVHAGSRARPDEYGDSILRLACDLPDAAAPAGDPPAPLAEHAATLAALAGDARAVGDALAALGYLVRGRGDDVVATVVDVLARLAEVDAPTRAALLVWLADAQTGGHRDQTVAEPERRRRHRLREDRAAIRDAVAAAGATIAGFLDDDAPGVRSAAALALTFCVDADADAKAALADRLGREGDVGVQAALVLALLRLGVGFRAPAPEPLIRAALAVGTAVDGAPNLAELVAAIRLPVAPTLAFNRGDLGAVAVGVLRTLPREVAGEVAPEVAAWAAESADAALAQVAMALAFGPAPATAAAPRLADDLTRVERQVARALLDDRQVPWARYGLPASPAARRRYFNLDPAGPFDRFVTDGDREVPLWFLVATAAHAGTPLDLERALADAGAAERLAIFLDSDTYGAARRLPWQLDPLLAAAGDDLPAARAAVDELVAATTGPLPLALVRAVAATRPDEALPTAILAGLDADGAARAPALLARFEPAAVEAWLLGRLAPPLAQALASDEWQLGLDRTLVQLAAALAVAASPQATRQLLLLGWASGQPAAVRAAVGQAAGHHAALTAVLEEYDGLPEFTSWPRARAALPTYAASPGR